MQKIDLNQYVLISASQLDRLKLAVKCWHALQDLYLRTRENQPILEALIIYNEYLAQYLKANEDFIESEMHHQIESLN